MEDYELIIIIFLTIVTCIYFYMLRKNEKQQIAKFAITKIDDEDNIWHDAPTDKDKIGFTDYAKVLANYIRDNNGFSVYGIYGAWGSGKTSLMKMVKAELSDQTNIWFDAWKFKGKVSIFDALCQIVGENLQDELELSFLKNNSKSIKKIVGRSSDTLRYNIREINEFNDNMSVIVNYLNQNKEAKIIIYVDDLDRCDPADAVEFLESLKVFFDVPRIGFVIGVNYDILYYEINKRYKAISDNNVNFTEEYLAKIVNIPFFIPTLDEMQIKNYIERNMQIPEVLYASDIFSVGLEGNLRTIKRIVNSFTILLNIAKVRGIEINPILLAKILVMQYRYKEIYSQILLHPNYLLFLQEEIRENLRYRRRNNSSKEEKDKVPDKLKKILQNPPYFTEVNLESYINLSQDKQNDVKQNKDSQVQDYLLKIRSGEFDAIPDLRVFPNTIRTQVIETINKDFKNYTNQQQLQAIVLLDRIVNEDVRKFFDSVLASGDVDIEVETEILSLYSNHDINIETHVWKIISVFDDYDDYEKNVVLLFIIRLIENGNRFSIDVLTRVFDKIDWGNNNYIINERVVKTLGESNDKKAIDLIVKFFNERDIDITHEAFDAIGKLDVNALLDWYDVYVEDMNYRGVFLGTIAKHANKNDKIINKIEMIDIMNILKNEKDESSQISEIKLLHLIAMKRIDEMDFFAEETPDIQITPLIDCLSYIARYDDKWSVRAEAEKTKEQIIGYKDERVELF